MIDSDTHVQMIFALPHRMGGVAEAIQPALHHGVHAQRQRVLGGLGTCGKLRLLFDCLTFLAAPCPQRSE